MKTPKKEVSRRGFLETAAVSALGTSVIVNAESAGVREAATADSGSRTLISRPAAITVVSYPPLLPDEPDRLRKTLTKMEDYVGQASRLESDLVAFPEICNTLGASKPWQFEPLDGPTITAMSRAAKENSIYVVCPMATLENGTRYNSSVLIGREGKVEGIYHKNFPTHGELDVGIVPGTKAPVFQTDFGRVGLSICFDLNYWEVGSALCANKAELVIWSSMWEGSRMLTKWAIEFGFFIGASYSKCSSITDIVGRELVSLKRNVPTDELIKEFNLEPMRDYLARVRRDRQKALKGAYPVRGKG